MGFHDVVAARIVPSEAAEAAAATAAAVAQSAEAVPEHLRKLDSAARLVLAGAWAFHKFWEAGGEEEVSTHMKSVVS